MNSPSVAVTGIGVVSPLGVGLDSTWDKLIQGESGIDYLNHLDEESLEQPFGGNVWDFDPDDHFDRREKRRLDPFAQFGLVATREALNDAGYSEDDSPWDGDDVGVAAGSGIGGIETTEDQHERLLDRGANRVSPMTIPRLLVNMLSGQIAKRHGFRGPSSAIVTACATSLDSIGLGMQWIRTGRAKTAIVGGAEFGLTPLCIAGFEALSALSERNDEPKKASRPFDKNRDGFVMGSGSAMLVLEEQSQARERGANIHGWLEGYGQSNDAHHETSPPEDGSGAALAMERAIDDSGKDASSVDHVNAHATSTPTGDEAEVNAIQQVLDSSKNGLHVTSTKSMTGHLLGGAGALEAVNCLMALKNDVVPPTINCHNPEPN
ncbi:MAG: beta-ketoacyl synthase, partial [bacterium]